MSTPTCSPWRLDYASGSNNSQLATIPNPPGANQKLIKSNKKSNPSSKATSTAVVNPMDDPLAALGFGGTSIRMKRAWELAFSPAKSLPMNAFMLYMSGSGVQIFSMGTVFMLLSSPIKAMSNIQKVFQPFQLPANSTETNSSLLGPKILFVLCQCLTLALGLWKVDQMGVLPRGASDFLAFETRGNAPERSFFMG
ncbi:Predicted membrane protein [Phaffia rhodozyma]|uniref:ER membrane protein complex subunit 4 n=1 Tax=Phaffia rhodozyma TaxID=264483 RepID=A0A0F7SVX3_PHARH|nr:Predicted membrane protein [Phaffia rhodozyma]